MGPVPGFRGRGSKILQDVVGPGRQSRAGGLSRFPAGAVSDIGKIRGLGLEAARPMNSPLRSPTLNGKT